MFKHNARYHNYSQTPKNICTLNFSNHINPNKSIQTLTSLIYEYLHHYEIKPSGIFQLQTTLFPRFIDKEYL